MKIISQGLIQFLETIKDPVTDFLEKPSLDHSDVAFPRALVFGFVRSGRQDRKAHVIGKVTISRIDIGVIEIGPVDSALEIVHHHVGGDPAKVCEHPLLDPNEGGKLLIEDKFPEGIRTERQNT